MEVDKNSKNKGKEDKSNIIKAKLNLSKSNDEEEIEKENTRPQLPFNPSSLLVGKTSLKNIDEKGGLKKKEGSNLLSCLSSSSSTQEMLKRALEMRFQKMGGGDSDTEDESDFENEFGESSSYKKKKKRKRCEEQTEEENQRKHHRVM